METIAFLGCSKGLGRAVVQEYSKVSQSPFLLISRTEKLLTALKDEITTPTEPFVFDLSRTENLEPLIDKLHENQVTRIFYFAGGGPFGLFAEKQWKDHQWGLNVTFLSPAKLIHSCLNQGTLNHVKQFICIGSQLADSQADPFSASYASAKHGLRGLISTLAVEQTALDLRLFRPGYMDTIMLPKNAKPRIEGDTLVQPEQAAEVFKIWAEDPSGVKIFDLKV